MTPSSSAYHTFRAARDFLISEREDYATAYTGFQWPQLDDFNWALDWFDVIAAGNDTVALRIVEGGDGGGGVDTWLSFAELADRSNRVASWLRSLGIHRGDRVALILGNTSALWETLLALMKLGAVALPLPHTIDQADAQERMRRSGARGVVAGALAARQLPASAEDMVRVVVGADVPGWAVFADSHAAPGEFVPDGLTRSADPLMGYFTSGTSSRPKLVEHTHSSYPIGHLSSLYFNGLMPGDVHLNVSDAGWAKHSWSSMFVPWTAEATVVALSTARPAHEVDPALVIDVIRRCAVTSLCAPPRVWRALARLNLPTRSLALREATSAGGHLEPDVVTAISKAFDVTIRDGYGQTETTAQIGNTPGQTVKPGSVGRALPGYRIVLLDPATGRDAQQGEISVELGNGFPALMSGYIGEPPSTTAAGDGGPYRTGDLGRRDADGYISVLGRVDDMFKCEGHRVSPAEVESVLLAYPMVAEAAVVGVADSDDGDVPKAFVRAAAGVNPDEAAAMAIFRHSRDRLSQHARLRHLAFVATLPTTTSGKIRRAMLRNVPGDFVLNEFAAKEASINTEGDRK